MLPSCPCHASNDITKTLKTPQRLVWKNRNRLTRSTNLFPLKEPLKNEFWRALPYPLSGSAGTPWASLGECLSAMCTLMGERYHFFEKILGLLRQIREESLNSWRWLDSNRWSRHDLREDPQLKERNPQLIPNISQVVGPLQGYIRRPFHGERCNGDCRGETYDLVSEIPSKQSVEIDLEKGLAKEN